MKHPLSLGYLLVGLLLAPTASAVPLTWTFTATVREVTGVPDSVTSLGVKVGAQVTGFVNFEFSTPDVSTSPDVGQYMGAVREVGVTIGNWSIARGIFAPDPGATFNGVYVSAPATDPAGRGQFFISNMYDPTASFTSVLWALDMSEQGRTFWPTKAMLAEPPPLGSLDPFNAPYATPFGGTDIVIFGNGPAAEIHAELTSLERVALEPPLPIGIPGNMPEPEALALVALGLLGFTRTAARAASPFRARSTEAP